MEITVFDRFEADVYLYCDSAASQAGAVSTTAVRRFQADKRSRDTRHPRCNFPARRRGWQWSDGPRGGATSIDPCFRDHDMCCGARVIVAELKFQRCRQGG